MITYKYLICFEETDRYFTGMGFVLNPYDRYVANITINGNQCTILWHANDLKILYVSTGVVTIIIKNFNTYF